MYPTPLSHSPKACMQLLRGLFSDHESLLRQLAPSGWIHSPYVRFFHPSSEQQYHAYRQWIQRLSTLDGLSQPASAIKPLREFPEDDLSEISARDEFLHILGLAAYDIFSDGHQVVDDQGLRYSLGSARGSAKFLADFFTYEFEGLQRSYDYLDFYMGSVWIHQRADMGSFYRYVFGQLRQRGLDWHFHFAPITSLTREEQELSPKLPGPHAPLTATQDSISELVPSSPPVSETDRWTEAWEEARHAPLPPLVAAYRQVYDCIPIGHPWRDHPPV